MSFNGGGLRPRRLQVHIPEMLTHGRFILLVR